MPSSACPFRSSEPMINGRQMRMLTLFGRLAPGVTATQAQTELDAIAKRLHGEYPGRLPRRPGLRHRRHPAPGELTAQARPTLLLLLGTAAFVLLIACANVANLSLARLVRREREMALRAALGADRGPAGPAAPRRGPAPRRRGRRGRHRLGRGRSRPAHRLRRAVHPAGRRDRAGRAGAALRPRARRRHRTAVRPAARRCPAESASPRRSRTAGPPPGPRARSAHGPAWWWRRWRCRWCCWWEPASCCGRCSRCSR